MNSVGGRPDPPTFFVDRSAGRRLAEALRALGYVAHYHDDKFDQSTDDPSWLLEAGKNGWTVITRDDRIRYRPEERQILERARVVAIIMTTPNMNGADAIEIVKTHIKKIIKFAVEAKPPSIALLNKAALTQKM